MWSLVRITIIRSTLLPTYTPVGWKLAIDYSDVYSDTMSPIHSCEFPLFVRGITLYVYMSALPFRLLMRRYTTLAHILFYNYYRPT